VSASPLRRLSTSLGPEQCSLLHFLGCQLPLDHDTVFASPLRRVSASLGPGHLSFVVRFVGYQDALDQDTSVFQVELDSSLSVYRKIDRINGDLLSENGLCVVLGGNAGTSFVDLDTIEAWGNTR
jgi:hypothetical protein